MSHEDRYWKRLEAKLPEAYSPKERELIRRAYQLARDAHAGQTRASGEPYISHCVAVAEILLELNMPATVVAAGLLHDVLEDTEVTYEELSRKMGSQIAELVEGVTKIKARLQSRMVDPDHPEAAEKTSQGTDWQSQKLALENLRKIIISMGRNIRVVPIKLADRLHNMRTLHYLPPQKRLRIARETLEVFAPLARWTGIERIQRELEDLAFKYIEPQAYHLIASKLQERRSEREAAIRRIIQRIQEVLEEAGIQAEVRGRPKHLYSIYQKMQRKQKDLEELLDLRGVRIILPMNLVELEEYIQEHAPERIRQDPEALQLMQEQAREVVRGLKRKLSLALIREELRRRYNKAHKPFFEEVLHLASQWFHEREKERKQATAQCYTVLGLLHTHWQPLPNSFDDYIATPKPNGYRSLHTALIFDDGKPVEVQIRTSEMHQEAEYGLAAHWAYKEEVKDPERLNQQIRQLRSLLEWGQEVMDAADFMDGVKTDLFADRVYVFTPKGDIVDLPKGATPIDFAYYIHTEIGHRCRGARVNNRWVPLNYQLQTGDVVEIITAKRGGPSRDWLNPELGMVKTQRARSKIRRWFRQQAREQNLEAGREMLERELARLGLAMEDIDFPLLLKDLGYVNAEDLFVALGCGDVSVQRIVSYLNRNTQLLARVSSDPIQAGREILHQALRTLGLSKEVVSLKKLLRHFGFQAGAELYLALSSNQLSKQRLMEYLRQLRPESVMTHSEQEEPYRVDVTGLSDIEVRFAQCCKPKWPDEIVGYITQRRGLSIHHPDCPNFLALRERNPHREIKVQWSKAPKAGVYPVHIHIHAYDRTGLMRDVADIIMQEGLSIRAANVSTEKTDAYLELIVGVHDLEQAHRLIQRLNQLPTVKEARIVTKRKALLRMTENAHQQFAPASRGRIRKMRA